MLSWLKFIPDVLGLVATPIKGYIEAKKLDQESSIRIKEAKTNATIAYLAKDQDHSIDWDEQNAKNAATSWKDEFWTIVLAIPAVLCFIPGGATYVADGFAVLKETPEWYQYALLVAISAAFGWSKLMQWKKGKE